MSSRLHCERYGGAPSTFIDLAIYLGGQLKIQVITPRELRSEGFTDRRARVYRGEIEAGSVDGSEVEVHLAWVAQTSGGRYTFVPSFDPIVTFHVSTIQSDIDGNCELITEQRESMVFFEDGNPRIIPLANIKDEPVANPAKPSPVRKELPIEEIERKHTYPEDGRIPHVPFGFANASWVEFKSQIEPGDKIYSFESSPESWRILAGREGYILVRNEKVIATMITRMS